MQKPLVARETPGADIVQKFLDSLHDLHVKMHVVRSEEQMVSAIKEILSAEASKSVVVAGIPVRYLGPVKSALSGLKATFIEDMQGKPPKDAVNALATADTGITWAFNGLAMEGALLEIVYDDSFKLASSLPIVHIAMLNISSILLDLSEAMPLVGEAISKAPPKGKPIISFISGPSKTGDIEMRLLYGVHGPHTVHAVVIDWS